MEIAGNGRQSACHARVTQHELPAERWTTAGWTPPAGRHGRLREARAMDEDRHEGRPRLQAESAEIGSPLRLLHDQRQPAECFRPRLGGTACHPRCSVTSHLSLRAVQTGWFHVDAVARLAAGFVAAAHHREVRKHSLVIQSNAISKSCNNRLDFRLSFYYNGLFELFHKSMVDGGKNMN